MKRVHLKDYKKVIVHIVRDLEYKGGVEAIIYDIILYDDSNNHMLICTEGMPGRRTKNLIDRGKEVYYFVGTFYKKVLSIQKIINKLERPILHTHLYRPEIIGVFLYGCQAKITTKYATYASDSHVGNGFSGKIRRYLDNKVFMYIVGIFYNDIIVITDELMQQWRIFQPKLHFVPISTIREYGTYKNKKYLDETNIVLMSAARMVREKQYDLLIDTLRHIKFKSLYMLGDGPLYNEIQQKIHRFNIKNVHMIGAVSRKVVIEYMDISDVFLLTSQTEGLPLLIQEAMSRGLPVVATNVGGNKTLFDNATGVVVDSADPIDFANGIRSLYGKDSYDMSKKIIFRSKSNLDFDKSCQMISKIYNEY